MRSPLKRRSTGFTSSTPGHRSNRTAVRSYNALAEVERAFGSLKTIDLCIRLSVGGWRVISARTSSCASSAYYVEWIMVERGAT
jgi:hypothetical protein